MILFVAYGGGHVAALAPVAQALESAGQPFMFLALTTAKEYLDRLGIPSIGFRDLPGADSAEVQTYGKLLARGLPSGGPVAHEETVAYLGLNYRDLVNEYGAARAAELYAKHGRQAFLPIATLKATIAQLQPQLVVATNSPRAERAAIVAARECNVRSLCLVDLFATQEIKWVGLPGFAERVCVLNEDVRQNFIAFGRQPEEVIVTGNPAFDSISNPEVIEAGRLLRQESGWNDGRTVVLFASQPEPDKHPFSGKQGDPRLPREIEQYLRDFVVTVPGFRLVVRYHPSEHVEFVPAPLVEFSPRSQSLPRLLHAVDIVVVTSSTVGLEGAIAGRRVVSVDNSVFQADAPYSEMGISVGAPTVAELGDVLCAVVTDMHATVQNGNNVVLPRSPATRRVLEAIKELL